MFTGIIEGTGKIKTVQKGKENCRLEIVVDYKLGVLSIGESIAVNGVCLTVTSRLGNTFWADVSFETMNVTTLGNLKSDDAVNLERPLRVGDRLGGHIVQGHVDAVGKIVSVSDVEGVKELEIEFPPSLARYIVEKGSIAVDGVSLTVNQLTGSVFKVAIIPHTQLKTTFDDLGPGDWVNLEVDVLGKYLEQLTFLDSEAFHQKDRSQITKEFLKKHGF